MEYFIGEKYRYAGDDQEFVLKAVGMKGMVFYFECGHRCTDNVFIDLIRVKTGRQNFEWMQMNLF